MKRERIERGAATLVSVLVGMSLGAVVIGTATTFALIANSATAQVTEDFTDRSDLIQALNRITYDVTTAETVVSATATDLVLLTRTEAPTWVRWHLAPDPDGTHRLITQTAPADGDYDPVVWNSPATERTETLGLHSPNVFDLTYRDGDVVLIETSLAVPRPDRPSMALKATAAVGGGQS